MNPFIDVWNSFKTGREGLSGRKMAAFWAITIVATGLSAVMAYYIIKKGDDVFIQLFYLIVAWLVFGSICLGLVTIPELIKFLAELKNGKPTNEPTTTNAEVAEPVN